MIVSKLYVVLDKAVMADAITSFAFKKILMLNSLEEEKNIDHELFPNHSIFRYLVCGPKSCGRTSLLFEVAFQYAENEKNVLFISNKKFDSLPCLFSSRSQPSASILKRIKIFYTPTPVDFLKLLAGIHSEDDLVYDLLLVDNLDEIYNQNLKEALKAAAKLCAFLFDAVHYFRRNGCTCKFRASTILIVSVTHHAVRTKVLETLEKNFYNLIQYYPHHSGNGFIIKSSSYLDSDSDSDVIGIHVYYKDGKICLNL